jgi:hypothetical protein
MTVSVIIIVIVVLLSPSFASAWTSSEWYGMHGNNITSEDTCSLIRPLYVPRLPSYFSPVEPQGDGPYAKGYLTITEWSADVNKWIDAHKEWSAEVDKWTDANKGTWLYEAMWRIRAVTDELTFDDLWFDR